MVDKGEDLELILEKEIDLSSLAKLIKEKPADVLIRKLEKGRKPSRLDRLLFEKIGGRSIFTTKLKDMLFPSNEEEGIYHTVYSMVKRGKRLSKIDDLKNEIVYSVFGIEKDRLKDDKELYDKNLIRLGNKVYGSTMLFNHLFTEKNYAGRLILKKEISSNFLKYTGKERSLDQLITQGGRRLIENLLGKGMYPVFNYAHDMHLAAGEKRAIVNDYMVHPLRVAYRMKNTCNEDNMSERYTRASIIVALLHDVVESGQKLRNKKLEEVSRKLLDEESESKYGKVVIAINNNIENPPELGDEGIIKLFKKEKDFGKKINRMIGAISNSTKKSYNEYIKDMFSEIDSYLKDESLGMKEFYDVVLKAKLADAIDNTASLTGVYANKQYERIEHNIILAAKTLEFLKKEKITTRYNERVWDMIGKLIAESDYAVDKIQKHIQKEAMNIDEEWSRRSGGKYLQRKEDGYSLDQGASNYNRLREKLIALEDSYFLLSKREII